MVRRLPIPTIPRNTIDPTSETMNTILVINGSPKGKNSITLHTCLFLEKKFPGYKFDYLDAGQRIKVLEKDFSPALEAIREADLLVFCYPVYTFLVPSQLHRFLELMKGSGLDLSGKAATQVTTSKHFYDITAHRFIEDNCADMGLPFLDGLSADMDDILSEKGRKQAMDWFEFTLWKLSRGEFKKPRIIEGKGIRHLATVPQAVGHDEGKKAVIVTDLLPDDDGLKAMIERFIAVFPYGCDVINIEDFPFQGGCTECVEGVSMYLFPDAFSLTTTVSAFYVFNRYKRFISRFLAFSGKYNSLIQSALQNDLYRGLPTHFSTDRGGSLL